jgi:trimeric autotransporter adhesin
MMNFSGSLTDGTGKPLSGTVGVTFSLYKDAQGGSPLWLENQNVQADGAGHYKAMLGSASSHGLPAEVFVSGEARWLGVQVQGQAEQARVLLLSVPYALKAGDAQTIGGLPPSAFVMAAPVVGGPSANPQGGNSTEPISPAVGGSGTLDFVPLWTPNGTTLGNSIMFQAGTGSTAKIGINETTPLATLDVKGTGLFRGLLEIATTGFATPTQGFNSQPFNIESSAYNSATSKYTLNHFQWQAEPTGNNTSNPSATLNLLYGTDPNQPAETGLKITNAGVFAFAPTQTFPGTISGITTGTGSGLVGGGTNGTLSLSLLNTCASGQILQWSGTAWSCATATGTGTISGVTAGTDLTGGGTSGTVTLNVDTTKIPQLNTTNVFTGNQTVNGNISANAYQIGGNLFNYGSYSLANASLGFAGNSTMTGGYNVAAGYQALVANTSGASNAGFGSFSLWSNTTGSQNTALGSAALYWNTTGIGNTATGFQSLNRNSTGGSNTATGYDALFTNTTGAQNTGLGYSALFWNSTGLYNTATGFQTLNKNTTGYGNAANGADALFANTTGGNNSAFGTFALYSNTTGANNTANGYAALYWNTAANNTAVGFQALNNNTTGNDNTASGYEALFSNTQGVLDTAFGSNALLQNTSGLEDTAAGYGALRSNTSGSANTATGALALHGNTSGGGNTANGTSALYFNNVGSANVAVGDQALYVNTSGHDNTAVGSSALLNNDQGFENTAVGSLAFQDVVDVSDVTCIGYACSGGADGLFNATAIGAHAIVGQSNSLVLGGTGKYSVKVGIGTTTPSSILTIARGGGHPVSDSWETYSSRRWKTNIQTLPDAVAKIEQMRGVSYNRKDNGKREIGVIAEEVGAVIPEVVSWEANGKDASGVDYARLTAVLIEAVKEQQAEIAKQEFRLAKQNAEIGRAMRQIAYQIALARRQTSNIKALETKMNHYANDTKTVSVSTATVAFGARP